MKWKLSPSRFPFMGVTAFDHSWSPTTEKDIVGQQSFLDRLCLDRVTYAGQNGQIGEDLFSGGNTLRGPDRMEGALGGPCKENILRGSEGVPPFFIESRGPFRISELSLQVHRMHLDVGVLGKGFKHWPISREVGNIDFAGHTLPEKLGGQRVVHSMQKRLEWSLRRIEFHETGRAIQLVHEAQVVLRVFEQLAGPDTASQIDQRTALSLDPLESRLLEIPIPQAALSMETT